MSPIDFLKLKNYRDACIFNYVIKKLSNQYVGKI